MNNEKHQPLTVYGIFENVLTDDGLITVDLTQTASTPTTFFDYDKAKSLADKLQETNLREYHVKSFLVI